MSTSEKNDNDVNVKKQKIRDRYKGIGEDNLDIIPARPKESFYNAETKKRVAVYARVSTDDPNQTSSYELQKNHYEDFVNNHTNWELVDIYADEGISGTSLQHRDNFVRMINDCHEGKIDLIVTKSVSRFARNIIDCIGYVRQLKSSEPPIGVFFETENIYTLDENSEMSLSFIATLAQEESHTKSEIMNSSIEMRFKRGIFLTPKLLGYDHDENGNLIVNEDEAKTVRLIFFSYLYGYSTKQIADALTELERLTKKGNAFWSAGTVLGILSNERYCGDVLARKTYTPNYLNHKSKKNKHDRNQYLQKNHHEAIITREDFFAVQKMIRNAKYKNKGYFPEMKVIRSGTLKGYVSVHPKWAGFSEDDYYVASNSVFSDVALIPSKPLELKLGKGSFDLSGYELVRSQFISTFGLPSVTLSGSKIQFNKAAIMKIPETKHVELLVLPQKKIFAVRQTSSDKRLSFNWCNGEDDERTPKKISGMAFLPTLFGLFGWRSECSYKIIGRHHRNNDENILFFDTSDAVMYVSASDLEESNETSDDISSTETAKKNAHRTSARLQAYPSQWISSFGEKYYTSQAKSYSPDYYNDEPEEEEPVYFKADNTNVTSQKEAAEKIKTILTEMGCDK